MLLADGMLCMHITQIKSNIQRKGSLCYQADKFCIMNEVRDLILSCAHSVCLVISSRSASRVLNCAAQICLYDGLAENGILYKAMLIRQLCCQTSSGLDNKPVPFLHKEE